MVHLEGRESNLSNVRQMGAGSNMICAAIAGMITAACTNPIWVLKTRMQTQLYGSENRYRGIIRTRVYKIKQI